MAGAGSRRETCQTVGEGTYALETTLGAVDVLGISTKQFLAHSVEKEVIGYASSAVKGGGTSAAEAGGMALIAERVAEIEEGDAGEASELGTAVGAGGGAEVASLPDKVVPSWALSYTEGRGGVVDEDEVG